jgi:hexaprenyl-diphosphate synthase
MSFIRTRLKTLLGSSHPTLDTVAKYYFQAEGKHIRPMIVLLMSQATNGMSPRWTEIRDREMERERLRTEGKGLGIDQHLSPEEVLSDENPTLVEHAANLLKNPLSAFSSTPTPSSDPNAAILLPAQRRLAEIIELIHVASLLHDDVIDVAETRRGSPSAPNLFGNKLSILAGDFLLARASLAVSRLGSLEVVELIASTLANLVEGEVMQMKGNVPSASSPLSPTAFFSDLSGRGPTPEIFDHYLRKTYLKTASLIAKSTRASTILGGAGHIEGWSEGEKVKDLAYEYGRNLGIAFQVRFFPFFRLPRFQFLSPLPSLPSPVPSLRTNARPHSSSTTCSTSPRPPPNSASLEEEQISSLGWRRRRRCTRGTSSRNWAS